MIARVKVIILHDYDRLEASKVFINKLITHFPEFKIFSFELPGKVWYDSYPSDYSSMKNTSKKASLLDLRDRGVTFIRLFLHEPFFSQSFEKQVEDALHEFGHYHSNTNTKILEVRNFVDLYSYTVPNPTNNSVIRSYNEGLNWILQIPKLIEEIHAEKWCFENYPEISRNRLEGYYKKTNFQINDDKRPLIFLFNLILNFTYNSLWKEIIYKNLPHGFSSSYLDIVKNDTQYFRDLLRESNYNDIVILLDLRDDIVKAVSEENIQLLKYIYLDILGEYARIHKEFVHFPIFDFIEDKRASLA